MNIERLEHALSKFKTLKNDKFYFGSFIKEWDYKNNCGTTCCLAGWCPILIPEIGLKYDSRFELLVNDIGSSFIIPIMGTLYKYFEAFNSTEQLLVDYLFGVGNRIDDNHSVLYEDSNLDEVLNAWQIVINDLKKKQLK